jgi:hypothetical protein
MDLGDREAGRQAGGGGFEPLQSAEVVSAGPTKVTCHCPIPNHFRTIQGAGVLPAQASGEQSGQCSPLLPNRLIT